MGYGLQHGFWPEPHLGLGPDTPLTSSGPMESFYRPAFASSSSSVNGDKQSTDFQRLF